MKKYAFRIVTFTVLLMSSGSIAYAQYVWKTILDQKDDSTSYRPLLLACNGNHCTAVVLAGRMLGSVYEFLRSDDAGLTWRDQWDVQDNGPNINFVFAIQQIDSLNVVAVGDSGHIFRTFDGGSTWSRQTCPGPFPATTSIWGVHFHDPMNGIIGLPESPATTTDGGLHWTLGPYTGLGSQNCHCYGSGKYAVLNGNTGVIYHTSDSWSTIDSTLPITNKGLPIVQLTRSDWGNGDTILGFGYKAPGNSSIIIRTTNGGTSWKQAELATTGNPVSSMTSISDDTLFAGCDDFAFNSILFSSDLGQTWSSDSVPAMSQGAFYKFDVVPSIARPAPGVLLAVVQNSSTTISPGLIIRGTLASAGVGVAAPNTLGIAHVYPDPTEESIYVDFDYRLAPIQVLDLLGRVVMKVAMPENGLLVLDVSKLPRGIYYLIDDRERAKFIKE